jgi:hypothetical protein
MFDRVVEELECVDQRVCMSSTMNELGVHKLTEEGIRKIISKQEGIVFNIVTAIDDEEYSKRMEGVLKHDGIQYNMQLIKYQVY